MSRSESQSEPNVSRIAARCPTARSCRATRRRRSIERVVKMSKADEIQVQHQRRLHGQHALRRQPDVDRRRRDRRAASQSRARSGRSTPSSTTNDLSDEALRRAVEQSEALAKLAPDDPEAMPRARRRSSTSTVNAYFDVDGEPDAGRPREGGADRARAGAQGAATSRPPASSSRTRRRPRSATTRDCSPTTAPRTRTTRSPCAPTDGTGSGWAGAEHPDWTQLDFADVSAARDREGAAVAESGRDRAGPLHRDPRAAGGRRSRAADRRSTLDARSADEGRSPFTKQGGGNKIGEKIVDERVTIYRRSVRSAAARAAVRRRGPAARHARCWSRTACSSS